MKQILNIQKVTYENEVLYKVTIFNLPPIGCIFPTTNTSYYI